ncbi:MAG: hypothetical protein J6B87_01315 [Clostridia bacterium]|nr:hypothetical protein [Clostridia bacterium]
MKKIVSVLFPIAAFVLAIIAFGKAGAVGAVLSALVVVGALMQLFFSCKGGCATWIESRKKAAKILQAQEALQEAREDLAEAKEEADLDPSDAAKQAAVVTARQAVANAKTALAAAKA